MVRFNTASLLLIFFFMLPTIALSEVDDQKLAALVFKEALVYELQRDWQNALAYYKKAVDLHPTELYRYKAAYAATQCKPPRWDVAERFLSRNKEVDSLLLLVEISQRRKDWRKAHSLLKKAKRQASEEPRVLLAQARLAYNRWEAEGQPSDAKLALDSYRDYLNRDPNSSYRGESQECLRKLKYGQAGVKLNWAIEVLRTGDFKRAWDLLNTAEELYQKSRSSEGKTAADWAELAYWRGQICMIYSEDNPYPCTSI